MLEVTATTATCARVGGCEVGSGGNGDEARREEAWLLDCAQWVPWGGLAARGYGKGLSDTERAALPFSRANPDVWVAELRGGKWRQRRIYLDGEAVWGKSAVAECSGSGR